MSELDPLGAAPRPAAPPPAPPPRRRRSGFLWGFAGGCLILFVVATFAAFFAAVAFGDRGSMTLGVNKVAIVPLEGEIIEARQTVERLQDYARNRSVRAIVVRINSPGGGVAPSQEIYSAIRRIRKETGKPVVASIESVGASGGYYVAAACDSIVANPGSLTGSIGVIAQWLNVEELMKWARLRPETLTSGAMKDAGSPFRPLTDEEKEYFQALIGELHGQFVGAIAEGRKGKLSLEEITLLADGRVFTGEQARRLKLVDQTGSLQDAVRLAGRLAGIKGEPSVIYPRRREAGLLELLMSGDTASSLLRHVTSRDRNPFEYRW
jgi:protease IV